MRVGYGEIARAIKAALKGRVGDVPEPQLMPVEPPRAWGVSTNICFLLGPRMAKDEIELKGEGLGKKERKQLAAKLAREGGEWLAGHLAEALQKQVADSVGASPPGVAEGGEDPSGAGIPARHSEEPGAEAAGRADASEAGPTALPFVARVEAEGAYVNFYYDAQALASHVVASVLGAGADFGKGEPTGRLVMVEYAQPNTHKDFHVGHLRNASIGQTIANLLEFAGNEVLKATYIGDIGKHVAKAMFGDGFREDPNYSFLFEDANQLAKRGYTLAYYGACYEGAHRAVDPASYPQDYQYLVATENVETDEKEMHLRHTHAQNVIDWWLYAWEETRSTPGSVRRDWLLSRAKCDAAFKAILAELLVAFDDECSFYESTVDDTKLGQKTAEELKELGIAEIDESEEYKGALFVDFEKQADAVKTDGSPVFGDDEKKRIRKLGKMTILRSDGTSLYQTKELGLAKHKFDLVREKYGRELSESLYVVGAEQKLYFEQVFAILRLWSFPNAENCRHVSYELVVLPEGKMSSREGNVVAYRELRHEAIKRAEKITREKGIAGDVKQTARDVAIAAIKYAMLEVTGSQQIVFDFERALSFTGRAAPYLQYAYARTRTLVEGLDVGAGLSPAQGGSETRPDTAVDPGYELHGSEVSLARLLSQFPGVCREAAQNCEPATLCTYLYDLAGAFSEFYRDCRVLNAEEPARGFRRRLSAAFRQVMQSGFRILALPLPEEM